jgi:hypothetical protein
MTLSSHNQRPRGSCRSLMGSMLAAASLLLLCGIASAQVPAFDVTSSPTLVIASGGSEVLGTVVLTASITCGSNADGHCVSTGGTISALYVGTPIANDVSTGVTVSETIGGVTTTAPTSGTLITGTVTVANTSAGAVVSIGIRAGVDLAAGDQLTINGVRGVIVSSPASAPGTSVRAQLTASPSTVASLSSALVTVGFSSVGLAFVSAAPGPGSVGQFTITYQEGFAAAFVQYLPTAQAGLPANPRPLFGALNNTQVHFVLTGLDGRAQWPPTARSQLAGGAGASGGGSELELISQNFDGSQATYEFATADQGLSDSNVESFSITVTVCGSGTVSVQGQLFPGLNGRPGFNDPLTPTPGADPVITALSCVPNPLVIQSGNNQFGVVGATLAQPLVVKVQDASGNPVPNVTITFSAVTAGASVAPLSMATNNQGIAQAVATLGPAPGTDEFVAAVDSLSVTFNATAVPAAIPPFPLTKVLPHVVAGGGYATRITVIDQSGQMNPIQINFISQAGEVVSSQTQTLPANGRIDVVIGQSDRFGVLTTEWAALGSQLPAAVSAFIELKSPDSDTPVTVTGYAASDPVQNLTLPFGFDPAPGGQSQPLTAGLAVTNVSINTNSIGLSLIDASGAARASANVSLPPFGQTAFVLSQLPEFAAVLAGQSFTGSVIINASSPVSVVDVGSDAGQFFSAPAFRPTGCSVTLFSPSQTTVIPHVVVGGGWATRLAVTNLCQVENPLTIDVFDEAGNPVQSFISPSATATPLGTMLFSSGDSERSGPLAVRWARITSQVGVGVHELLDFVSTTGQPPQDAVGSSPGSVLTQFILPVDFAPPSADQTSSLTVGLALANPNSSADNVVLQLMDTQGAVVAQDTSISLPANGQAAVAVAGLPGFVAFLGAHPQFSGTLQVTASQPTTALAAGFDFGPSFTIPVFAPAGNGQ